MPPVYLESFSFSLLCTIEYTHTVLPNLHIVTLYVEIVMLEKLDCILSKSATTPYIYESTSVNACVRIYV